MSYIENIRKNVAEAIVIKKNAKSKNIDYITAKIMYHNGANDIDLETAKKIKTLLEESHVPVRLIDTFDLIDEYNFIVENKITHGIKNIINKKIHQKVQRKYVKELSNYIFADDYYGEIILKWMKKGIPLKAAIQLFEIKLRYEMKKNNLSEIAALAKILFYENNETAKIFERAYLNNRVIYYKPSSTIKNEILFEDEYKKKKVNGITLVSKTDEGIKKLEYIVRGAFDTINSEMVHILQETAEKNKLMLSDINFTYGNKKGAHYLSYYNYIHLNETDKILKGENINSEVLNEQIMVFYHEITHFLDDIKGNKESEKGLYYSEENPIVNSLLDKIGKSLNPIQRGLSLAYLTNMNAKRYANNPELNQRWMQEIKDTFPTINKKDIKIMMQQKRLNERKKFKLVYSYLIDIYDALTGGKLYTYFSAGGHGKKYYKTKHSILTEFIANIGLIYDSNETDILRFELGDELTEQLIDMYREFIRSDGYTEKQK